MILCNLFFQNNHLSIEEFHAKLQEATNFPLRPFVIPFLKANLPLLQVGHLYHLILLVMGPHFAKRSPKILFFVNELIMNCHTNFGVKQK